MSFKEFYKKHPTLVKVSAIVAVAATITTTIVVKKIISSRNTVCITDLNPDIMKLICSPDVSCTMVTPKNPGDLDVKTDNGETIKSFVVAVFHH